MAWQLKAGKWVWKKRKPIYRTTRRVLRARTLKKAADRYKGLREKNVKTQDIESSGDQDTSRTWRSQSWRSTQGHSAQSSKRKSGQYIRRSRMTKRGQRKRGPRTLTRPWCWRHNRRHFCQFTRKR